MNEEDASLSFIIQSQEYLFYEKRTQKNQKLKNQNQRNLSHESDIIIIYFVKDESSDESLINNFYITS